MRAALAELAGRLSEHPVKKANLHLTLAFLGSRTPDERACVEQAAGTLSAAAFRLIVRLRGTRFRDPGCNGRVCSIARRH